MPGCGGTETERRLPEVLAGLRERPCLAWWRYGRAGWGMAVGTIFARRSCRAALSVKAGAQSRDPQPSAN